MFQQEISFILLHLYQYLFSNAKYSHAVVENLMVALMEAFEGLMVGFSVRDGWECNRRGST